MGGASRAPEEFAPLACPPGSPVNTNPFWVRARYPVLSEQKLKSEPAVQLAALRMRRGRLFEVIERRYESANARHRAQFACTLLAHWLCDDGEYLIDAGDGE